MKSFTGKIEPMGMSIFMQGSHQLVDDKGEMIVILQGDQSTDLQSFVNKKVTVTGETQDSVEGGGTVLVVKKVESA